MLNTCSVIVTVGDVKCVLYLFSPHSGTLRVWELDLPNRKIRPTECQTGQLKRVIKCIEVRGVSLQHDYKIIYLNGLFKHMQHL